LYHSGAINGGRCLCFTGLAALARRSLQLNSRGFSSVLWLDGSSEDSLKQNIARCASRVPESQISDISRQYSTSEGGNVDAVVVEVLGWLALPDNSEWLIMLGTHSNQQNLAKSSIAMLGES
jgi:hypothetical protein